MNGYTQLFNMPELGYLMIKSLIFTFNVFLASYVYLRKCKQTKQPRDVLYLLWLIKQCDILFSVFNKIHIHMICLCVCYCIAYILLWGHIPLTICDTPHCVWHTVIFVDEKINFFNVLIADAETRIFTNI